MIEFPIDADEEYCFEKYMDRITRRPSIGDTQSMSNRRICVNITLFKSALWKYSESESDFEFAMVSR